MRADQAQEVATRADPDRAVAIAPAVTATQAGRARAAAIAPAATPTQVGQAPVAAIVPAATRTQVDREQPDRTALAQGTTETVPEQAQIIADPLETPTGPAEQTPTTAEAQLAIDGNRQERATSQ